MTEKKTGNQWAYLTNYSVNQEYVELQAWGDKYPNHLPTNTTVQFTGLAPATPEILRAIQRWMDKPPQFPFYAEEWMCLYCGSPNPLPKTHCEKCGAPRNWLIG